MLTFERLLDIQLKVNRMEEEGDTVRGANQKIKISDVAVISVVSDHWRTNELVHELVLMTLV